MRPDEDINHLARERQASPNSIKFAEMLMNYGASIPQLAPTIIQVASIFLETQKIEPLIEMKEFLTRLCDVIKSVHCKTEVLDFSFAGLQVVHRKSLETMIASNSRVTRIDLHRGNRDIHTADDMRAFEIVAAASDVKMIAVHSGTTEAIWRSSKSPSGKIVSADASF